jgi:two-component system sensor histidine kinase KdpD
VTSRGPLSRAAPYAVAIGGALAITAVIGVITARASVSGLSAFYLLLVLWLGARWGRRPAVAGSIAAFLLYDFFFVPPVGTFAVRGPAELLELVVLLAVALAMVCERATRLDCVERFGLVAMDLGHPVPLAGPRLTDDESRQAGWSYTNGRSIGIAIADGAVKVVRARPNPDPTAYLPLASGVAVIGMSPDHPDPAELRMLAALIGLADLLLDRRRAALEAERVRGLEASDRLKAAILSSLSHELKSPIASLRTGLTALTAPQAGLQPDQRELLVDLDRQAGRLDHMVGDMLVLSRLEAGVELDKEPHAFADLVGSALHALRPELKEHRVHVQLPDDLPPVEVDELQVGRVITNLLENAAEWSTPTGAIEVGAAARDGELEAWVENEGPAIAPADLDRVFETFWTRRARGSGLGLAICKRVVEAHGGVIRVENRRRGPRFSFTLPLARVAAER